MNVDDVCTSNISQKYRIYKTINDNIKNIWRSNLIYPAKFAFIRTEENKYKYGNINIHILTAKQYQD